MATTIKDVARLAQCSIKTVSRVVNHESHVNEALRIKVEAAIRSTGYAPNQAARRLAKNRSFTVCILFYPGFSPPTSALLSHLLDLAYEENYDLLLQTYYPTFPKSRQKLVDLVREKRFDGFISTPPCEAEGFVPDLLRTYKQPLVQVNPLIQTSSAPFVTGDDVLGSRLMLDHLIDLGHQRIACLRGPRNFRSSDERLNGAIASLRAHGMELEKRLLKESEFTFDGGYTATRELLQLPQNQRPTAIYAASDEAALGSLFAAHELNFNVPGDVSIGGHDDIPLGRHIWPPLTTVHQPPEEMLETALRMLIAMLDNKTLEQSEVILKPNLVMRRSTSTPGDISS